MTVRELHEMNFNEAASILCSETDSVTTYESLKEFAKYNIDNDNLYLAMHVLDAINRSSGDFYAYDFSMGTLETPTPLLLSSDLEDYCE